MSSFWSDVLSLGSPTPGSAWRANLESFRLLLLIHMGVRSFLTLLRAEAFGFDAMLLVVAIAIAIVGSWPQFRARAVAVGALLVGGQVIARVALGFDTANHVFLEGVFLTFFALCRLEDEEEATFLLQCTRLTTAVFFFYTGLQKVFYGYYFDGQFLAYMAATSEFFHLVFQYAIPAEELERLMAFNGPSPSVGRFTAAVGAGPYRVDSPLFVLLSNFVYVFEMGAGILLLNARARNWAAFAAIGFVLAIEAGARELTFGILMINLLLLYTERAWVGRLLPLWLFLYAWLVLGTHGGLGWLPMFRYAPA